MKTNLFIVGAPKAGTTSILDLISLHKDVGISSVKEPNYFSYDEIKNLYESNRYIKLLKEYVNEGEYHFLFGKPARYWAEASVSYLYYPGVAQRIKSYNSTAKIIICLREPVSRALSHHEMDLRLGFTNKSLIEILKDPEKHQTEFAQYVTASRYSEQVSRYLDVFGVENVLVLYFEDITNNPEAVINSLGDFLELGFDENEIPHQNRALRSNSVLLSNLYRSVGFRRLLKFALPITIREYIKKSLFSAQREKKDQVELKKELYELIESDLHATEILLDTDLSRWKSKASI